MPHVRAGKEAGGRKHRICPGPFLMEPEGRMETNENGFCRRHFELLYNTRANRLGLGLIVDTHMVEQTSRLKKKYEVKKEQLKKMRMSLL